MASRQRLVLALVLGILTAFAPVSIDMYLPSLPTLGKEFASSPVLVQATLSVFFIGLALGQGVYGPMSDRHGRKGPLYVGISVYILGSVVAALAPTIEVLVGARFLQAIGGCAGVVIARAVVRDYFDERESARMLTTLMLVMGLAPILAPTVGGQLLTVFGWRSIFWVLAGFGLICLLLTHFGLRESWPHERRQPGGLRRAITSYIQLALDKGFLGYALTAGSVQAGLFAYLAGSPFVFIELYGVPAEHYGLLFGFNALGLIAASQINHRLLRYFSSRAILRAAVVGNAIAAVILAIVAATDFGGLYGLLAPLFVSVASLGFISPNAMAAAMAMHGRIAGSASAFIGMLQFSVGAVAATVVGLASDGTARPMAFIICACGLLALLLQHLWLRQRA